jgi:hypothetical protein
VKLIAALLILISGSQAFALEDTGVAALLQKVASQSGLAQLESMYGFCSQRIADWNKGGAEGKRRYESAMLELAATWKINPEPTYKTLETCQNIWDVEYYQPLRVETARNEQELLRMNNAVVSWDLLKSAQYLPAMVQLYNSTRPKALDTLIPAPYQVISGISATAADVDIELNRKQMQMSHDLTSSAVMQLTLGIEIVNLFRGKFAIGAKVWKPLIFGAVAAEVLGQAAYWNNWQETNQKLRSKVQELKKQLKDPKALTPKPILVDEFYKAVMALGYFYSFDVYLQDSQLVDASGGAMPSDDYCLNELYQYASTNSCGVYDFGHNLADRRECRDPAAVWLGASQFLQNNVGNAIYSRDKWTKLQIKAKELIQMYEVTIRASKAQQACLDMVEKIRWVSTYECDLTTGKVLLSL